MKKKEKENEILKKQQDGTLQEGQVNNKIESKSFKKNMPIETNIQNELPPVTRSLSAERIPPLSESSVEKPTSLLNASNIKPSLQIVATKEPNEKPRNRDENRMENLLKSLQLEQYKDTFSKEEIDFDVLCTLEETDLQVLGMSLGARKKILSYLKTMKEKSNRSTLVISDKILEQETLLTETVDQSKKNNTSTKNPQVTNIKKELTLK
jgi:hypothetical protein